MRAVVSQVCGVCNRRTRTKAEMDEHIAEKHGVNWAPAQMVRAKDQMEFKPNASSTPWGKDLR
jgi:hypothetical protein